MLASFAKLRIQTLLLLNAGVTVLSAAAMTTVAAFSLQGAACTATAAFGLVAVLLAVISAWWLLRRLAQPLQDVVDFGRQIAKGDLRASFKTRAAGEVGEMQEVLQEIKDGLYGIVRDVRSGAIAVKSTSKTVKDETNELSHRNEAQAGSLEETAAALEQLTSTVKHNADNAAQANHLVGAASEQAVKGGEVVGRVIDTMESIKQSSDKIVDIISVIDGIAFQTNILALNAAVEAARAGEQGRGFAVVASEVRNLAQRSASAAKEIKGLISDSVSRVETGSTLVNEAGKTMTEIVTSVKHVAGFMSDIANASKEQSIGIAQVNETITQFDSATQENAALVESALKSAENLDRSSSSLSQSVEHFQLGAEIGNADDALALVQKAIAFAKDKGVGAMCEEVNKQSKGKLTYKDLYITVYDPRCKILAHGANRHFIGVDALNTMDADGKPFNQELLQAIKPSGKGWTRYKFAHPITQEIKTKSAYAERLGDVVVTCGCYVD